MIRQPPLGADGDPDLYVGSWEHLREEIFYLDLLLARGIHNGRRARQADPLEQLRGLVVSDEEVDALLGRRIDDAGANGGGGDVGDEERRLRRRIDARVAASLDNGVYLALPVLATRFGLDAFETGCLLLALAPEVDRKYDKLFAYLQDDVTRKRPTVALALDLFASRQNRLDGRAALAGGPLIAHRLLEVVEPSGDGPTPLLARSLKLDDRIAALLLGDDRPDPRLAPVARLIDPVAEIRDLEGERLTSYRDRLAELARRVTAGDLPERHHLVAHLRGPRGSGRRLLAAATARELGLPLLLADLSLLDTDSRRSQAFDHLAREAFLLPAVLAIEGFDELLAAEPGRRRRLESLLSGLGRYGRVTFFLGASRWRPERRPGGTLLVQLRLARPDEAGRLELWRSALAERRTDRAPEPSALASEFRFTPGQVWDAVAAAEDLATWHRRPDGRIAGDDLTAAARAQASPELARLARRVESRSDWTDLVLPDEELGQLKGLCEQARQRHRVFGDWGFGERLTHGRGLTALFSGPPGTGKTLAAAIVARELELDLFKIDLSQVVSKYIGETEKNLDRIFTAAEDSSAILFFDEADALFGKRSEVRDSHDRYANVEVSYLLQKMEEHEGIAVLATNLRQHLDEAFIRRLSVVVEFPFPDAGDRERIWRVSIPERAPVGDDLDLGELARQIRLAGGNIRNISLAAAFYAADDGQVIRMPHLWRAAQREFQKMGRSWSHRETGGAG